MKYFDVDAPSPVFPLAMNFSVRGFAPLRSSKNRSLLYGLSLLGFCASIATADTDLVQSGQITLNPSSGPVVLTLQGPAFDSASATNYGFDISYSDAATSSGVFRLVRLVGQYQWQFSTQQSDGSLVGRLAMQLGNDHSLTIIDPANSSNTIVLRPGTDVNSGAGVYWNNQRLATVSEITSGFVPVVNGNVGIGTPTPQYALDVHGATSTTTLYLPATTAASAGVIYQGTAPLLQTYGTDNLFLGAYAGNFGQQSGGVIGGANVGVGSGALANVSSGSANVALGDQALLLNQTGSGNIAMGAGTMFHSTNDTGTVAIGHGAGYSAPGDYNSLIGYHSGQNLTTTYWNTALGANSLASINGNPNAGTGNENTTMGANAMSSATSGSNNTVVGSQSGYSLNSGSGNVILGWKSGFGVTTGSSNILIGNNVDMVDPTASNTLNIGNLLYGTGLDGTGTTASTGKIGINTTTPAAKLDVNGDAMVRGVLHVPAGGDIDMGAFTSGTNPNPPQQ